MTNGKKMPNKTVYAAAALFLIVVTQPGCAAQSTSGDDDSSVDNYSDALRASTTIDSDAVVTYLSSYFAGAADASMRSLSTAEAGAQLATLIQARVMADLGDVSCVSVDTDGVNYVDVNFNACTGAHGKLSMSGGLHAQIGFETAPCGPASCPVAVTYFVSTTELTIGRASVIGNWTVNDPLAADKPYTWNGLLDVVTPERGVTFTSQVSFSRTGDCVDADVDAILGGSGQRSLTITASNVHRCMGECPTSGQVNVTNQDGATFSWIYEGQNSASVSTEAGNIFAVGLTCNDS